MNQKLEKLLPPGSDVKKEIWTFSILLISEFMISLIYLAAFSSNISKLYYIRGNKKYLWPDATMPPFGELMQGKMFGFAILVIGCIIMAAAYYMSFYRDSKSIYVMKRLKNCDELIARCISLPLCCITAGIILFAVLVMIYSLIYFNITPKECIPVQLPVNLWGWII